jgi:hypothetical protein
MALGASSDLQTARGQPNQTRQSLDDAAGKTTTFALLTDILGGAALVGAGISVYLTVTAGPSAPEKTGTLAPKAVRVGLTPGGVSVGGTF